MARTRAEDYDDKRGAILSAAARIFAEGGYDRTSMAALAASCGVSKALLYHYYRSKEALLYDIIEQHLTELVAALEAVDAPLARPEARLGALIEALLDAYAGADAEHRVQIMALATLPDEEQDALKALERRLVAIVAETVEALAPETAEDRRWLKPAVMSLFGMLNWAYMWFREDGPLSRRDYARMVLRLFVDGLAGLAAESAPARRRA